MHDSPMITTDVISLKSVYIELITIVAIILSVSHKKSIIITVEARL